MQAGAVLVTSYDDWSLTEFAKHSGEKLPGDKQSPKRFKQRADWVLGDPARKAAWIRWRCECMTRFYAEAARHLAVAGPNAKLRLMIQQPYPTRDGNAVQELLEQGLDLEALAQNPQIILDRWLNQTAHRSLEKDGQDPAKIYYDQAELTPHFQKPFAGLPRASATVHQQYFESHQVLGNRSAPKLTFPPPWGIEAYGRACQPVPWGRYFLRHWARSVFLFDAQWLAGARNAVRRLKTQGPLKEAMHVKVAAGTYRLAKTLVFEPQDSGTVDAPIIYEAAGAERPVFTGGRKLQGFAPTERGRWKVHLSDVASSQWYFEDLYVNGRRATRAREPNEVRDNFHWRDLRGLGKLLAYGIAVTFTHAGSERWNRRIFRRKSSPIR